jgi:branched-chain amino acid transport system ATP-binding protein
MDEPSEGLAPVIVEQLVETIRKLVGNGELSVLLVEQRIDIALDLASRCVIMDRGRIAHLASSEEFKRDRSQLAQLMGLGAPD